MDPIKIGHLVGLGSKVHGSRFRVNRFANFFDLISKDLRGLYYIKIGSKIDFMCQLLICYQISLFYLK